jgi:hypothetical protein
MDRERKLLYAVAVLAVFFEGMTLTNDYLNQDLPSRAEALEEARDCKERLIRTYRACFAEHNRAKGIAQHHFDDSEINARHAPSAAL